MSKTLDRSTQSVQSLNLADSGVEQPAPERQILRRAHEADYWRELNPELSITENPFAAAKDAYPIALKTVERAVEQVRIDGYAQLDSVAPPNEIRALADAVGRVVDAGFPGPLAIVYDEIWSLLARISGVLTPILGSYRVFPDLWIYHVDGRRENAGWSIHRDDEMDRWTLDEDGRPRIVTVWIPLTDATPENSCIYVLPTSWDPHYPDDLGNWDLRGSESSIRALPARAGSVLLWNQYVLHWGSRHSSWASGPRISLAVYAQSDDVAPFRVRPPTERSGVEETPTPDLVDLRGDLPFGDRLRTAGRMVWKYRKIVPYPEEVLAFCREAAGSAR